MFSKPSNSIRLSVGIAAALVVLTVVGARAATRLNPAQKPRHAAANCTPTSITNNKD